MKRIALMSPLLEGSHYHAHQLGGVGYEHDCEPSILDRVHLESDPVRPLDIILDADKQRHC